MAASFARCDLLSQNANWWSPRASTDFTLINNIGKILNWSWWSAVGGLWTLDCLWGDVNTLVCISAPSTIISYSTLSFYFNYHLTFLPYHCKSNGNGLRLDEGWLFLLSLTLRIYPLRNKSFWTWTWTRHARVGGSNPTPAKYVYVCISVLTTSVEL